MRRRRGVWIVGRGGTESSWEGPPIGNLHHVASLTCRHRVVKYRFIHAPELTLTPENATVHHPPSSSPPVSPTPS